MKKLLEKNSSIGFWMFFFVVGLGISSLNSLIWSNSGKELFFTGGYFISAIMFLAGYLLMSYYKDNRSKKSSTFYNAFNYTKLVFKKLYPALLGGVFLAFIVKNTIMGNNFSIVIKSFFDSIWEFIGLSSITFGSLSSPTALWNEPLWLFSAIIISSFILYYLLEKNEDLFAFFAIIFALIVYGIPSLNILNISYGLLRVLAAMSLGALLYYIVRYFQSKKFSELLTMAFSIIHIGLAMFIIYTWIYGYYLNELTTSLVIYILFIVVLANKDYISVLYNDFEIGRILGNLATYYYAAFVAFIALLAYLFPQMGYYGSIIFNIMFTICWAIIMLYFDDYFVKPVIFYNKKKDKKKK